MSQWEARVNELFSTAIICSVSHDKLLQMTNERIYSELNRKYANGRRVYPAYINGYIQGLMTVHRANLYRHHLEFCYDVDGVIYSTHRQTTRAHTTEEFYAANKGYVLCNAKGAHYWKDSDKQF
jgi:hypothetical protein